MEGKKFEKKRGPKMAMEYVDKDKVGVMEKVPEYEPSAEARNFVETLALPEVGGNQAEAERLLVGTEMAYTGRAYRKLYLTNSQFRDWVVDFRRHIRGTGGLKRDAALEREAAKGNMLAIRTGYELEGEIGPQAQEKKPREANKTLVLVFGGNSDREVKTVKRILSGNGDTDPDKD